MARSASGQRPPPRAAGFFLSLGLCYTCYTLAHVVPLFEEIPTVHSKGALAATDDYLAVYLAEVGSVSLGLCTDQAWLLGPLATGLAVTTLTWKILHYDTVGGPKVQQRPSLQLGKVVAVLNGILMCLYYLFYNLRLKPAGQKHSNRPV